MRGVSASSQPSTLMLQSLESKTQAKRPGLANSLVKTNTQQGVRFPGLGLRCNSTTGPGGPTSGDRDSKSVVDAFFLGKALAEALNERVESAVGEFLSAIGRLQAERQKLIQEFQEDVVERARKAKEQAGREALEAQGLISKPNNADTTSAADNNSVPSTQAAIPMDTNPSITPNTDAEAGPATNPTDTDPSTTPNSEADADPATKASALGGTNEY